MHKQNCWNHHDAKESRKAKRRSCRWRQRRSIGFYHLLAQAGLAHVFSNNPAVQSACSTPLENNAELCVSKPHGLLQHPRCAWVKSSAPLRLKTTTAVESWNCEVAKTPREIAPDTHFFCRTFCRAGPSGHVSQLSYQNRIPLYQVSSLLATLRVKPRETDVVCLRRVL